MTITFVYPDGTEKKYEAVPAWTSDQQAAWDRLARAILEKQEPPK